MSAQSTAGIRISISLQWWQIKHMVKLFENNVLFIIGNALPQNIAKKNPQAVHIYGTLLRKYMAHIFIVP